MKKLLLTLVFLLSIIKMSACKCVMKSLPDNYINASVVGVVKIVKVYGEDEEKRTYKADIEFERIYKGIKFKTLDVRGLIGRSYSGACEIDIELNERYLILLNGYDGKYVVSSCSPLSKLEDKPSKSENSKLNTLSKAFSYIDKNKFKFINLSFTTYYDETRSNGKSELSKIKNFQPKQPFAIYKVKINGFSRIQEISPLQSFGSKDKVIEDLMKKNFDIDTPMFSDRSEQKEFLILLLYFKENSTEIITCNWW